MAFTGSLVENRISLGVPAQVRQDLYDEAFAIGIGVPELIRQILSQHTASRRIWRETGEPAKPTLPPRYGKPPW